MHKDIFKIILAAGFLCALINTPLYAEFVFLKDGTIIEGTITGDAADSITIYTKEKQTKKVYRSQIMRVLYTEFKMSRVYIQKRDGQGFAAYLVDEDRTTYTFRKELYKPEEFTVKREEVLFMAEKNPSGLKGEPGTTSVELAWLPPYDAVKKYNIYMSQKKGTGYVLAQSSGGKSATVKDLKSNTTYYFLVKSVDADGYESGTSNELSVLTLNRPPEKFLITRVEKLSKGGYTFEWNEASDPDGKVSGYRIYRRKSGKMELISETKKRSFTVPRSEEIGDIYITAFDELKAESGIVKVYDPYIPEMIVSANPAFLLTTGKLKDIFSFGFGVTFKLEVSNYILSRLELAPELSVYYLMAEDDFNTPESSLDFMMLVPLMFNAGYAFYPFSELAVIPYASAGVMAVYYDYNYFDIPASEDTNRNELVFDPAAGVGISLRYGVSENISLNLGIGYSMFFEEDENLGFMTVSFGAGMNF